MSGGTTAKIAWDLIQLKCGDCGSKLIIKEGPWECFYSCESYPSCYNRISINIYEKMLDKIAELLIKHEDVNLTGYKWRQNYYSFKIERHLPERFIVLATNMKKSKTKKYNDG